MSTLNVQVIEKLIEAKRLEKEAFMMLLPEKMQKHLEVIGNEVKAIVIECLLDLNENADKQEASQDATSATLKKAQASKVKKVDIG